jgi:hypothetical protein
MTNKERFDGLLELCKNTNMVEKIEGISSIKLNQIISYSWISPGTSIIKHISINRIWFGNESNEFMLEGGWNGKHFTIFESFLEWPEIYMNNILNNVLRQIVNFLKEDYYER